MTTANVASATNSLSSAQLGVSQDRNPARSLVQAGVSLARLELTKSFSCLGKAVSDAAYNFAHPQSLMRDSQALKALHAAA
jgi:hypothetical protein